MGATGNLHKHQHFGSAEQDQLRGDNYWRNCNARSTQHLKMLCGCNEPGQQEKHLK